MTADRPEEVCLCVYVYMYIHKYMYEGWNFNSGNYLFTTDTK